MRREKRRGKSVGEERKVSWRGEERKGENTGEEREQGRQQRRGLE